MWSVPVLGASGLLGLGTALLLLLPADACMQSAWDSGRLGASELLRAVTLTAPPASSCTCCALCHHQPRCASLSFNTDTAECELYNTAASFTTLQPDPQEQWRYFVMPGRSQHHQFCRQHSDCQLEGDACRGRVCTNLTSVTCRDIADTFGAGDDFGVTDVVMFGWLDHRETALECDRFDDLSGFTELLSVKNGASVGNDTILEVNRQLDPAVAAHSILGLADVIRQLREEPTYHILVSIDGSFVLTEQQSRVRREEALTIETLERRVSISFRNEQDVLVRVLVVTDTTDNTKKPDIGVLKLDGDVHTTAYGWIEIYVRE